MSTTVEMPLKTESVEEIAVAQPIYRVSVQDPEEAPPKGVLPPEDWPNIDHIETEDDEPVDNILSEKQQRLLTESLYSSWDGPGEGRTFMVAANVGIFTSVYQPPVVPDVFISLDVKAPANFHEKYNRSYFVWVFGKAPELVIEIVSNRKGNEAKKKMQTYAQMKIGYYVVYDPFRYLRGDILAAYTLGKGGYTKMTNPWFAKVRLGVMLWNGSYEGAEGTWLRWCDSDGNVIPTGAEAAQQEHQRAQQEHQRAQQERILRESLETQLYSVNQQNERLLAKLRELGLDID